MNAPMKGDITPLLLATQVNDLPAVRVCIDAKANPNLANKTGNSPVLHAAQQGYSKILELFMLAGVKPNDKSTGPDADESLPLHAACEGGKADAVKLLLQWGADVDLKGSEGATAAMMAVQANSPQCLELLLAAGADVNIKTSDEWTPLLLAVQENYHKCVGMLIEAGANPRAKNVEEQTATYLAAQYGSTQSLEIVLAAGADPATGKGGLSQAKLMAESEGHKDVLELLKNTVPMKTDKMMEKMKARQEKQKQKAAAHKEKTKLEVSQLRKKGLPPK